MPGPAVDVERRRAEDAEADREYTTPERARAADAGTPPREGPTAPLPDVRTPLEGMDRPASSDGEQGERSAPDDASRR